MSQQGKARQGTTILTSVKYPSTHCSCSQYGGPTLFLSITIAPCSKIASEETCKLRSEVPRHTSSLLVATLIARLLVTVHRLSVLQPIRYTLPTEYIPNYRRLAYTIGRDPLQTLLVMAAAVRYAATAGPHRVRLNATLPHHRR